MQVAIILANGRLLVFLLTFDFLNFEVVVNWSNVCREVWNCLLPASSVKCMVLLHLRVKDMKKNRAKAHVLYL